MQRHDNYDLICFLQALQQHLCSSTQSPIVLLCDPDGNPVIVRCVFSDNYTPGSTSTPVEGWKLDGTKYEGDLTALVSCAGGGGGLAFATYPICDNGTFKFVNLCGSACGQIFITYTNLNRTPADAPVDWDNVTYGPCLLEAQSVVTPLVTSGSGTITGGAYSVSVLNIGSADGVLMGQTLKAGQEITLTAFELLGKIYLVPDVTYDATGTTFSIVKMEF